MYLLQIRISNEKKMADYDIKSDTRYDLMNSNGVNLQLIVGFKFEFEQKKLLKLLIKIGTNLRTWTASFPTKYPMYKNLVRLTCKIAGYYT